MAIDKVIGVDVTTDSTILGISGLDKVNGLTLVSGGVPAPTDYVLQWRFNGDLTDTSAGGTYTGSAIGSEAYGIGQDTVANHALVFDGSSGVSRGAFIDYTSSDFSISFWVFVNTGELADAPVLVWKGAYEVSGYYGGIQANGTVFFETNQSGARQGSETAAGAVAENGWYNIIFTRAGASVKIYVNGTNATSSSGSHVSPASSSDAFIVGSYQGTSNWLTGRMDDVRVYGYELTSGQSFAINAAGAE